MIRICKNKASKKAGFTLLEMVLVIAIMMMMSFYLYSTFRTVAFSHQKVTVVNDMHDYASLCLRAIEKQLCNADSIGGGEDIKLDGNSEYVLIHNASALPGFTQYHTSSGDARWRLNLKISTNAASKTATVVIEMTDNADPSTGVAYSDSVTIYLAACKPENIEPLTNSPYCSYTTVEPIS
ncbi:MAG: prepilin-type N-terminal cleavage/methylation domain-containing protein [Clostridiales bacterium]|nr:prepilin-type N-terminal cleavage/methylation domain-containing protein [Clostridiales bacterium]MBR5417244.1 prepilin-type N-terminal cleavage/methylation domain-containing protein [Clostridiales bacterium]